MNTAAWIERAPPRERAALHWAWPMAVSLALLLAIVSGGSSLADSPAFTFFRVVSLVLLGASLVRLLSVSLALTEKLTIVIGIAAVTLVCLQLVPLPWGVFASLPGRDYVVKVFQIANIPPQAMPMTLSPAATTACLLVLMPPIAMYMATLTTETRSRWYLVAAILAGAVANVILGLAQRFQGGKTTLYLYEIANFGSATGFFSNRNNFAMLLCVSIPLTWAITHKLIRMRPAASPIIFAGGAVMMLIILMGLAASNSRSGILLGMLALTLSTAMVLTVPASRRSRRTRLSVLAILGGAFVIGQFGMTGVLRIAESDPLTDFRAVMRHETARAAADYFPIGSGFGTFPAVYAMHETPANMIAAYVNHAHNDWLELWLEGSLPAAVLLACFVSLFLVQAVRIWNPLTDYAESVLPRAASVGALVLLLHSMVEYPLRMPALAAIFACLIAIMMAPPHRHHHGRRHKGKRGRHEPMEFPEGPKVPVAPPVFHVSSELPSPRRAAQQAVRELEGRNRP